MSNGLYVIILLISVKENTLLVEALKCWKCIAHDCHAHLGDNYKAEKVKCQQGQMCMKVRYRMFDNVTHYDSVIRTCTYTKCDDTPSIEDFVSCIRNPAKYMISGCSLRSCCDDKDLCNSCEKVYQCSYITFFVTLIGTFIRNI